MKRQWRSLPAALLTSILMHAAHAQLVAPAAPSTNLSAEVLSDTKGVDLSPYMRSVLSDLKSRWLPLVAEIGHQHFSTPDETAISFTIAPDGKVSSMHLDHPTKNEVFDKTAWSAARSAHYPPLPAGLKDSSLKLRVLFPAH